METSAQKTKLTTSNTSGINTEIKVNGPKLEGSKPEILSGIAQTTAALTRLKPVWDDRSISLSSQMHLMCSLVTSIFLYACESWTLTAELQRIGVTLTAKCYTSHTKTMLPTRKSMPRSSRQTDHTKTSRPS